MTALDPGHTIRQPATALFTIDSEDRWTGYSQARNGDPLYNDPFNFTLPGNATLLSGFFTRIGVSEVVMPWCPNINPKTNKIQISYEVSGGSEIFDTITLPSGYYTPAEIASSLQVQIRTLHSSLSGFNMTYGADSLAHFAYSTGSTTTIAFYPMTSNSTDYPYPDNTKQLFDLIGMINTNSILATDGEGVYTLCQAQRYVDIVCPYLTQYQGVFDASSLVIARDSLCRVYLGGYNISAKAGDANFIPLGTSPAEVYRNFTTPKQIQWIGKQNITQNLTFSVYGDDGQLFSTNFEPFGSGSSYDNVNWTMTLLVSEN
jgi:hypothetical protein